MCPIFIFIFTSDILPIEVMHFDVQECFELMIDWLVSKDILTKPSVFQQAI